MAKSYIHELGDRLSNGFTADNLPKHIKEIAPIMYNDGSNNFNSIQSALNGKAASNHTHGNIANGGTLQTNDITIANGDKLVVTDSSDSSKVARASIAFDGSTTTQALTKAGTWATFNNYSLPLAASGTRGGIQIGYSESGTNYAVKLSSEKAYVTVPWTDTKVTQTKDDSGTAAYPLLMAGAADPNGTATTARYDSGVKLTPSTNTISANISGNAATATATSSGSITANDDLNTYKTANRNYLCNNTNASSVSNKPSGASGSFELEVIRGTGESCVQIYYSRDDVSFNYIRKYTGSSKWTDWVKLIDSSDSIGQGVANKLNVDGSNATRDGIVAMMKKAPFNSTIDTPADAEYYYSDGSDASIVRRPIRNIWNYINGKLGSAGSSERPIYIENGVPKSCDSVMPVSVIDSGKDIGYGVFVGGNPKCGTNTRCFCAFLITATANPNITAHTYIGTFTFRSGTILKSELTCLTGRPQYPLRIGAVFNTNTDSTYAVGLYIIPADKTVNKYANYKLTRVASSAFNWSVQALTDDIYNDVDPISVPAGAALTDTTVTASMIGNVGTSGNVDTKRGVIYTNDIVCNHASGDYAVNLERLVIGRVYRFQFLTNTGHTYLYNNGTGYVSVYSGNSSFSLGHTARANLQSSSSAIASHTVSVVRMSDKQIYIIWGY